MTNEMLLIKPTIQHLVDHCKKHSSKITYTMWQQLSMNSYERAFLLPYLDNFALVEVTKSYLHQCHQQRFPTTYEEAIVCLLAPLLNQRLEERINE